LTVQQHNNKRTTAFTKYSENVQATHINCATMCISRAVQVMQHNGQCPKL